MYIKPKQNNLSTETKSTQKDCAESTKVSDPSVLKATELSFHSGS